LLIVLAVFLITLSRGQGGLKARAAQLATQRQAPEAMAVTA
jgi:hypothetical protein